MNTGLFKIILSANKLLTRDPIQTLTEEKKKLFELSKKKLSFVE